MSREILLQKTYSLLERYKDLEKDSIEKELTVLEDEASQLEGSFDEKEQSLFSRLCASHCAANYCLYTGLFIRTSSSCEAHYFGEESVHKAVFKALQNHDNNMDTIEVWHNGEKLLLQLIHETHREIQYTFAAYKVSPFFTIDEFNAFTLKALPLVRLQQVPRYDFDDDAALFEKRFEQYKEDLHILYYHFKNLYDIFKHFGIDEVEKINEYLYKRLQRKYPDSIFVYQYSFEVFLVICKADIADKRIVFSYSDIPVPYIAKKIILRGEKKFKKISDYINQ